MKIKKIVTIIIIWIASFAIISCTKVEIVQNNIKPQVSQMRSICELATMECYYHNVAKYFEEDAKGILLWKKDKRFWIEYSGIVKIGIDASLVNIEVNENTVVITIPNAKVLGEHVDNANLNEESYIVDKDSADIDAEDQTHAFELAQENMIRAATEDSILLASAQQRAQTLLEDYVNNIGEAIGKEYIIEWKYINDDKDDNSASSESDLINETEEIKVDE